MEQWAKAELKIDEPGSLWAVQMAITFRYYGFYKEAIERSRIAHELEPDNWRADFCLAQTYALQNDYAAAIQTLSVLISAFRADQELMREFRQVFYEEILDFLGEWNSELSHYDAAMEAFREILGSYPERYESALRVMMLFKKQGKFSEIIQFLQDMNKITNDQGLSRLIAMYHQCAWDPTYHETISFAAQQSNSLSVIKEAYQNAVEAAKEDVSKLAILTALRYWYGLILFHDHQSQEDHDEAVSLWEQNIAMVDARGSSWEVYYTRSTTAAKLASVYLQRAKDAGLMSPIAQGYLKRLAYLSNGKVDGKEGEVINAETPVLLGRLYRLMGQEQEAKECMRGHVRIALDLLSDDDPSNDWQGYQKLALTLAPFNDDVHALAAWSLLAPVEDDEDNIGLEAENKVETDAGIAHPKGEERKGNGVDEEKDDDDTDDVNHVNKQEPELRNGVYIASEVPKEEVEGGTETGTVLAKSINDQGDATTPSTTNTSEVNASTLASATTNCVSPTGAQVESSASPHPEATSTSAAPRTKHGMLGQYCDGFCGHTWSYADDIYACKDCIDIQFESGCLEKLRNGTLERKVCGKDHEFLHVPKWDEDEHAKIPEGEMKVGGELVPVKDWLNTIRRQWGFDIVE